MFDLQPPRLADILRDHGPAWREANRGHVSLDAPPLATTEAPPAKQRISKKVQTAMDALIAGDVGAARLHCHREGREPSESRGRADQGTQTADPPHRGRRAPTRRLISWRSHAGQNLFFSHSDHLRASILSDFGALKGAAA
jgi:hypothetical protein